MWVRYNNNPCGSKTGDCAVRAISNALNVSWRKAYIMLAVNGFSMCEIMNGNTVIASVMRQNNFQKANIPNDCPDCFTIKDFCKLNPEGRFVLGTGDHVVSVIDGKYYDMWDSGNEIPIYVWYNEVKPYFGI